MNDSCAVCGFARIPGIATCVNCGEPEALAFTVELAAERTTPPKWWENGPAEQLQRDQLRRMTEARALEIAGDLDTAIGIYESIVAEGITYSDAHKRLAIVYKKLKRADDEERVVRSAIALWGRGQGDWFVLRLATILAKKGKA